jgi:tetratricopeptide (TPR) repeat protein
MILMRFNRSGVANCAHNVAMAAIAISALLVLSLRALTHVPYFDETLHVRFLWLLSRGLRPGADYFCSYPILAYIPVIPIARLLPESAYAILALRGLSVAAVCVIGFFFFRHGRKSAGHGVGGLLPILLIAASPDVGAFLAEYSIDHSAALTAIWAVSLFFCPPSAAGLGMACGLSLLSVAITPKYCLPLFFGLLGYLAAALLPPSWRRARSTLAAALAGSIAAFLLIALLYWLVGVSIADNFRLSHLLMSRYNLDFRNRPFPFRPLEVAGIFISHHWLLTAVLAAGVAGWLRHVWCNPQYSVLPGAGVMLGVLVSTFALWRNLCLEQYMAPVLFCMSFFVPYAFPSPTAGSLWKWFPRLLIICSAITIFLQIPAAARDFRETPHNARSSASIICQGKGVQMSPPILSVLKFYESCLRFIPSGERVVAVWPYHPIFRRDLTWMTADDEPSFSRYLGPDDPELRNFAPEVFRDALERSPPAYIAPKDLGGNYPPGWQQVCDEFLIHHASSYVAVPINSRGTLVYFRRDLVVDKAAAIALFQNALEIKPDAASAEYSLGLELAGRGQIDEAISHFKTALALRPDFAEAHFSLGLALAGHSEIDEAVAHYRSALALRPDYAEAHCNLGAALASRGQIDEAIRQYQSALEIQPDNAEAENNMGAALAGRREFAEAIAHYDKAVEIKPEYAEAHYNLGNALAAVGRIAEARTHYERAVVLASARKDWTLADFIRARIGRLPAVRPGGSGKAGNQ